MQWPLEAITLRCGNVYIPHGVVVLALNKEKAYEFAPKNFGTLLFSLFSLAKKALTFKSHLCTDLLCFFFGIYSHIGKKASCLVVMGRLM
jgi:hypothetical protein